MKSLVLILALAFIATSCGKSGSAPNSNTDSRSAISREEHNSKLNCLETKLGWLENPPMTKKEIFKRLTKTSYVGCDADSVIVGNYTEKVLALHPNIQFKDAL